MRVEASPINPPDLGVLLGPADVSMLTSVGTAARPVLTAAIPPQAMRALAARLDKSMPVGNEGRGRRREGRRLARGPGPGRPRGGDGWGRNVRPVPLPSRRRRAAATGGCDA